MNKNLAALAVVGALSASAMAQTEYVVELAGISFMYGGQTNMDIDLTIHPGDSVRWVWVSGLHNVVSGLPDNHDGEFHSGEPMSPPFEFVHTFNDPADYPYHCHVHKDFGMISMVKVRCPADHNGDLEVNTLDVLAFLNDWSAGDDAADFNGDGEINTLDVLGFLNAWTSGC